MTEAEKFDAALARIDAENAQDPQRASFDGKDYPAELLYSQRMTEWQHRLAPTASVELRLAVRCQHLRRWDIPRGDFPMTRAGYYQWRTRLGFRHAEQASTILRSVGYDDAVVARVASLIRKERFKTDAEAQVVEDAACLVFLELDYVDFTRKHEPEKVVDVVRKTWRKMSDAGHAAAVELAGTLPEAERELIVKAISG